MKTGTKKYADFGVRLNELLEAQDIKAQELADRLDVSLSTVNFWRSGEMLPRHEKAEALAQMLAVSPGYLMFGTGEPAGKSKRGAVPVTYELSADRPVLGAIHGSLSGLVEAGISESELMPVLELLVRLKEERGGGRR